MAAIYDANGYTITEGLQSSHVCDEAINAAKFFAADREEDVYLEDGTERTTVHPDGTTEEGWGWE